MCRRDLARACERNSLPGAGREEERLLIRRFTRHARNETVAAAVARVLEPRFEAVDARFAALDTKWEHRFKEMEDESRSRDAAWKERFADLRNEMVTLRESFANLRTWRRFRPPSFAASPGTPTPGRLPVRAEAGIRNRRRTLLTTSDVQEEALAAAVGQALESRFAAIHRKLDGMEMNLGGGPRTCAKT